MSITATTLERCAESLAKAQQHWTGRHGEEDMAAILRAVRPWTIALTREAGTPGTSVARELAERLDWHVYDHELVEMIAREMGLRASLLDSIDESHKSWLQESIEGMASTPNITETGYVRHLVETILSLGAHGHCVIVGRGAAHLLPAETTLRVRLIGQLEDRVKAVMNQRGLSREQAERWVRETDRERAHFVRSHFFKDPTDPLNYDLILNTSRWSIAECTDFIVQALHQVEGHVRRTMVMAK